MLSLFLFPFFLLQPQLPDNKPAQRFIIFLSCNKDILRVIYFRAQRYKKIFIYANIFAFCLNFSEQKQITRQIFRLLANYSNGWDCL